MLSLHHVSLSSSLLEVPTELYRQRPRVDFTLRSAPRFEAHDESD